MVPEFLPKQVLYFVATRLSICWIMLQNIGEKLAREKLARKYSISFPWLLLAPDGIRGDQNKDLV